MMVKIVPIVQLQFTECDTTMTRNDIIVIDTDQVIVILKWRQSQRHPVIIERGINNNERCVLVSVYVGPNVRVGQLNTLEYSAKTELDCNGVLCKDINICTSIYMYSIDRRHSVPNTIKRCPY